MSKKIKPIIKFNGGYGAILCNKCRIIIKDNLNEDEFNGKTDLIYCKKCKINFNKMAKNN